MRAHRMRHKETTKPHETCNRPELDPVSGGKADDPYDMCGLQRFRHPLTQIVKLTCIFERTVGVDAGVAIIHDSADYRKTVCIAFPSHSSQPTEHGTLAPKQEAN